MVPRFGMLWPRWVRAARWRHLAVRRKAKALGPCELGAFSRCGADGGARSVNDRGIAYRPTQRSFGTTRCSARRPNRTQDHLHGLTRANPGRFRAGNDRNARQAGLQEDRRPRVKAVQARCPQIAATVSLRVCARSTMLSECAQRANRISWRARLVYGGTRDGTADGAIALGRTPGTGMSVDAVN